MLLTCPGFEHVKIASWKHIVTARGGVLRMCARLYSTNYAWLFLDTDNFTLHDGTSDTTGTWTKLGPAECTSRLQLYRKATFSLHTQFCTRPRSSTADCTRALQLASTQMHSGWCPGAPQTTLSTYSTLQPTSYSTLQPTCFLAQLSLGRRLNFDGRPLLHGAALERLTVGGAQLEPQALRDYSARFSLDAWAHN